MPAPNVFIETANGFHLEGELSFDPKPTTEQVQIGGGDIAFLIRDAQKRCRRHTSGGEAREFGRARLILELVP
jgi:hypothetical protein